MRAVQSCCVRTPFLHSLVLRYIFNSIPIDIPNQHLCSEISIHFCTAGTLVYRAYIFVLGHGSEFYLVFLVSKTGLTLDFLATTKMYGAARTWRNLLRISECSSWEGASIWEGAFGAHKTTTLALLTPDIREEESLIGQVTTRAVVAFPCVSAAANLVPWATTR